MPTGESISEVFVLKNPPTLVVRSVSGGDGEMNQRQDNGCPCCGLTVIHTGGCVQCPDPECGWSACG